MQTKAGNRAVQRLLQARGGDQSEELFNVPGVELPKPGGGRSLPDSVLGKMESAFGQDFSGVRVHEGPAAESVGALAYTQGEDIHFAPGRYRPGSQAGQALLGHELTHVVQQRSGRVQTPSGSGAPVNANRSLEAEADRLGAQAARHESAANAPQQAEARLRSVQPKLEEESAQRSREIEEEEELQG